MARLQGDLSRLQGQWKASQELSQVQDAIGRPLAGRPAGADRRDEATPGDSSDRPRPEDALVGGIPVDSEYVVFVIDTSGSMQRFAWPALLRKMAETLDAYPRVKGFQVMNDQGIYMFSTYAGSGSPTRRCAARRCSSASPPGTRSAPRARRRASRPPSGPWPAAGQHLRFGDEFTGTSIEDVIEAVDRLNRRGGATPRPHPRPRLPDPVLAGEYPENTTVRFAMLMRALCEKNGGTFVGLNTQPLMEESPAGAGRALGVVSLAVLLASSTWLAGSAAIPGLRAEWGLTDAEGAWLTIAVQVGFIAGTLLFAVSSVADLHSARRVFAWSAAAGAFVNLGFAWVSRGLATALCFRFLTGLALARRLPGGHEDRGHLVQRRPRTAARGHGGCLDPRHGDPLPDPRARC